MTRPPVSLAGILDLERAGPSTFRRPGRPGPSRRMFGGEAVGQAIMAAGHTVPADRPVVSAQAHFLLPGDAAKPIDFHVEHIRDGGTFSTRRIEAVQDGRVIFLLAATCQSVEEGLAHQPAAPVVPPPEDLPPPEELFAGDADSLTWIRALTGRNPIDCRFAGSPPRTRGARGRPAEPRQRVWMRVPEPLPDSPLVHRATLGYLSDLFLLATGVAPYGRTLQDADVKFGSIDHAVWLHAQPDVGSWLLYDQTAVWIGQGRALCRGSFFDRSGLLVATTTQQALMRVVGT